MNKEELIYRAKLLWHHWLECRADFGVLAVRKNYAEVVRQIQTGKRKPPYTVVFLVSSTSKWKLQSVYDELKDDPLFTPMIVQTFQDVESTYDMTKRCEVARRNKAYFSRVGMKIVAGYDERSMRCRDLREFHPDFVFYQTPWGIPNNQTPLAVSTYSLCCYVPYFVPTYCACERQIQPIFHRHLFRHYNFNEKYVNYLIAASHCFNYAGKVVATGHPTIDEIQKRVTEVSDMVMYAPHWSIDTPKCMNDLRLSTFLWNGREILAYAQEHPEMNWVFKPHPTLYSTLISSGVMTKDAVDEYYAAWEKLGTACYDGGYISFFHRSRVLITDCDSFLSEYGCLGKPIIHLMGRGFNENDFSVFEDVFNSYYRVRNLGQMYVTFKTVLEDRLDPKRELRQNALAKTGLINSCASKNIVADLKKLCQRASVS